MSGKASRRKGHDFERLIAKKLRRVFPDARRGLQYRDGVDCPDVIVGPFWVECKRGKRTSPLRAIEQADRDRLAAGVSAYPVAICKDDTKPATVTMVFDDWLALVDEWGAYYGDKS